MNYILTRRNLMPTARVVRELLSEKMDEKILITTDADTLSRNSRQVILRWGNSDYVSCQDLSCQKPELIRLLSNKMNLSSKLSVVQPEITTPVFTKDTPESFPVVIRETLSASKGKGIHIAENLEEFNQLWNPIFYWAKFFETTAEYRTHIVGGKVKKIFKKVGGPEIPEKYPVRTNDNYHFSVCNLERCPSLISFAERVSKEISEIGFFALDIGKTQSGFVVFEGNSAPGLNEFTGEIYTSYIMEKLNEILRPREIKG
jgi:glutathione synthase/RimK-type ligase-like ATP-grasp enzyme